MAIDRRKQVLEAAEKSFSLYGYKATTMEQVAKIAGVGKGTIYTFFSTKEELFDLILVGLLRDMKALAEREIRRERNFFDNLHDVVDALLAFRSRHELYVKLSQEVRDVGTPQAQEALGKIEALLLGYIEGEIGQAIARGELKPCEPRIVAFLLLRFYVSLTSEWSRVGEPLPKDEIQRHLKLLFEDGLAVK